MIAHRASTTAEANGFAGVTNNVPTGTVNGDVLIWRISSTSANPPALLAGWNEITPTVTVGAGCSLYWYRIASSEPASYTTAVFGSAGRSVGVMSAYSGVDNTTPFDVATPTPVTGTTAFGSLSITPVTPGALVLSMARAQVGTAVLGTTLSSTNLDAIDAQVSSTSVSATNEVGAIAHEVWITGAFTPDWSSSQTPARTAVAVAALRPTGWVASTGTVAGASAFTSSASYTSGAITSPIGDQVFLFVSFDNLTATTPTISSITKAGGETASWVQIATGDSPVATAAGGQRAELWAIIPAVTWTAFSPVVTLSGAVVAKASVGLVRSGGTLHARESLPKTMTTTTSATPSVNITTPIIGDLVLGFQGREMTAVGVADADTTNGSWSAKIESATADATSANNAAAFLQWKIVTASGTQTFNPTGMSGDGTIGVIALAPASDPTTLRVSRTHEETLVLPTPDARVSRTHAETLVLPTPDARVSRTHEEILVLPTPDARVSRVHVEVLVADTVVVSLSGTWTVS